jgi:RNA polymerase sigma factor (sigma-70 family)
MATGQLSGVLRHLRGAALLQGGDLTDGQLLECFLTNRDEVAFEALVRRHGPMVWGVCRRSLHNAHDAEDAFQATFLVLVRKAASIGQRELVGNWLYGTAYRAALETKTARRRTRERQVSAMPEPEAPTPEVCPDWRPVLDHELSRLPDKYRVPIVLCDLEGGKRRDVARRLGIPEGTLSSRLATARRMLAQRLSRHGLALAGGALAAALSPNTASAGVPRPLVAATVKVAALVAAGPAGMADVVPASVVAVVEGVMKSMLLSKLKTTLAVLAVPAMVAVLVALAAGAGTAAPGTVLLSPPVTVSGEKTGGEASTSWKAAGALEGHRSAILCLAFGPDQVVVTGDEEGLVRVWDAATNKELPFYDRGASDRPIIGITYAPDDSWVSFREKEAIHLAFGDKYINKGKPIDYGIGYGQGELSPLAIASDGKTYAFRRANTGTVEVAAWDIQNGGMKEAGTHCKGHDEEALCAAFSPDDSLLVTGSADKTARIWEAATGKEKHTLKGHTDAILVVAFSPDGKLVATAGKDGVVMLWDVQTGKERGSLKGRAGVRCLAFSPDGKTLASGGEDKVLRLWDVHMGKERAALKGHQGGVLAVGFSRDGSLLGSAGQDKTIRLWKNQK